METLEMEVEENNNAVGMFNKDVENNSQYSSSYDISDNSSEEVEACIQRTRSAPRLPRAQLMKLINPQHSDRLFAQILRAKGMDNVIHHWQNEYREDKYTALRKLYQLYVDLSTYQHINVERFLVTQGNDINELIPHLERSNNEILRGTSTYFLLIRNKANLGKLASIDEFIELFVSMCAKEKIIYDFDLFKKLIHFFVQMANSSKRPIRHTGVYIALKHQTGLVKIGKKINKKIARIQIVMEPENDPETLSGYQSKIEKLKNYDGEVNNMVRYLQENVFNKNWNFLDPKLHLMRHDCIVELYNWIKMFPDRHLYNNNLNFIFGAMTDPNKLVRLTVIPIIGEIVENYEPIIRSKLVKMVGLVSKHINDIDYTVSILAVDTINIFRRYINIPSDIRELLCKTIYSNHYPLAAACGRYLTDVIRDKTNDDEGSLRLLISFEQKAIKRGILNKHPYVIESVYDNFPVLYNIPIFMKLFESYDEQMRNIWLNMLTESVQQTFTGRSSGKREKPRIGTVFSSRVNEMKIELVRNFGFLMEHFKHRKLVPLCSLMHDHGVNIIDDSESVADLPVYISNREIYEAPEVSSTTDREICIANPEHVVDDMSVVDDKSIIADLEVPETQISAVTSEVIIADPEPMVDPNISTIDQHDIVDSTCSDQSVVDSNMSVSDESIIDTSQ